jgi:hypothetical protein
MVALALPKSIQKISIVGPIYNDLEKLPEIEKLLPDNDWIIFNDSISFARDNLPAVVASLNRMDQLLATGKVVYNAGCLDLQFASNLDVLDPVQLRIERWIRTKPNVVIANFNHSFQCIVVSGGIPPNVVKLEQLMDNLEVSFAIHPHQTYSGGLGYVVCNHPTADLLPAYFPYSAAIGRAPLGRLYALQLDRNGVRRSILL